MKQFVMMSAKTLLTIIRIVKNYRFACSLPTTQKENSEIHILANGPSLKSTLADAGTFFNDKDCMFLNYFVKSDFYEFIKPKYYVLMDPNFWTNDCLEEIVEIREQIYSLMVSKTTWSMSLILPMYAKKSFDWTGRFKDNSNIRIYFYNATPISGFKAIMHYLFKQGLGIPHAQNVLVAAIFLAINIGYVKIYLHGADHSWHEDLILNDNNVVCIKDRHFYDKSDDVSLTPWKKGGKSGSTWKMHEILMALAKMFEGYQILEEYAKYRNIKILNASKKTNIDAFERYDNGQFSV